MLHSQQLRSQNFPTRALLLPTLEHCGKLRHLNSEIKVNSGAVSSPCLSVISSSSSFSHVTLREIRALKQLQLSKWEFGAEALYRQIFILKSQKVPSWS